MSNYIQPEEYDKFGVGSIADDQIDNACAIVDAYLSRPEGMLYSADPDGYPIFMTRKAPEGTFVLKTPVTPGNDVAVRISSGSMLSIGSALVLDRVDPAKTETVYVKGITDLNNIILAKVVYSHDINAKAESGMTIENTLNVPKNRYFVTLPCHSIRRLVSAVGRVGYSRRGDSQGALSPQAYGIVTSVSQFGGAPLWQIINVGVSDIELDKNQVWTPMGVLMTPYSEVRMSYISGFPIEGLPFAIKRATANIAKAVSESPASSSVSVFKAGEVQMERFLSTIIDDDMRAMLAPYRAHIYG
jgi:hypothetical protein